jgi:hypothetical protein
MNNTCHASLVSDLWAFCSASTRVVCTCREQQQGQCSWHRLIDEVGGHCQICICYCCSGLNWFDWLIRCNRNHHFIISVWLCSLPWPCFQLGSLASLLQIESWLQLACFVFVDMTCLHSSLSRYLHQHLVNWWQIWSFLCFIFFKLDRACNDLWLQLFYTNAYFLTAAAKFGICFFFVFQTQASPFLKLSFLKLFLV